MQYTQLGMCVRQIMSSIMDITLYEMGTSRSLRCRWTLKEVGLEYKSIDDRSLIRSDELKKIISFR